MSGLSVCVISHRISPPGAEGDECKPLNNLFNTSKQPINVPGAEGDECNGGDGRFEANDAPEGFGEVSNKTRRHTDLE